MLVRSYFGSGFKASPYVSKGFDDDDDDDDNLFQRHYEADNKRATLLRYLQLL
jgi:hypothetical protein